MSCKFILNVRLCCLNLFSPSLYSISTEQKINGNKQKEKTTKTPTPPKVPFCDTPENVWFY